jgi:hypothetical protein
MKTLGIGMFLALAFVSNSSAANEAWTCTYAMPDKSERRVTFTRDGDGLVDSVFSKRWKIVEDNSLGLVALYSMSEPTHLSVGKTIGAHVVAIDKSTQKSTRAAMLVPSDGSFVADGRCTKD